MPRKRPGGSWQSIDPRSWLHACGQTHKGTGARSSLRGAKKDRRGLCRNIPPKDPKVGKVQILSGWCAMVKLGAMRTRCKVCCHKLCGNLEHGQHASILEKYSGWLHSHVRPLFPALLDQISLGNPLQGLPLAAACGWCFSYFRQTGEIRVSTSHNISKPWMKKSWNRLARNGGMRHFMAAISKHLLTILFFLTVGWLWGSPIRPNSRCLKRWRVLRVPSLSRPQGRYCCAASIRRRLGSAG